MELWQAIMVIVAELSLFITAFSAITNERLTRLHSCRLAFEMYVWREQNYERRCKKKIIWK